MVTAGIERPRLLYFADAMCSWCYGFAPEMSAILKVMEGRIDLLLFSGGLRPFNKEPMTPKLREYLGATYARIGEMTGQRFAKGVMHQDDFIYDTEPASRAVVTMRTLSPGSEYQYMLEIQRAFYAGGEDIRQPDVLADYAETFDISRARFLEAFASEPMQHGALSDFQVAKKFGIDGFPSIILHRQSPKGKDDLILIAKGYGKANEIAQRLEAALALPFKE